MTPADTSTAAPTGTPDVLRLVVGRELRSRGTSRAYQLGVVAVLVIMTGLVVVPRLLRSDVVEMRLGTLGEGGAELLAVAEPLLAAGVGEGRTLDLRVTDLQDEDQARAALEADDVEMVLVDGQVLLRRGSASAFGSSDLAQGLQQAAAVVALQDRLEGTDVAVEDVAGLLDSRPLPVRTIDGEADEAVDEARSTVAYGGMMLLYLAILTFGNWTLQGVTEEKSSRVVEVLLATVRPWQLLAGKIIGVGLLGLAQFAVTVGYALLLIRLTDALPLPVVPVDSAVTLVAWFVIGFAVYSVLFATAGALAGGIEDAQTMSFPVSLVAIAGFLASFQALGDPTGVVAQLGTYIPFTAPFVVPIRVAFQEIAVVEQLLAALLSVAMVVVLVRIAARVYAGGALHVSGRLGLRAAWRGARETTGS